MWLVNGRPDVAKTTLFRSLWRVWGRWDWRSALSGHTRRQEASLSRRFTGGCSAPLFLCWGTPLGPERGDERKKHAAPSHCSGLLLVSPGRWGESQTRTRELHQLPWVPSAPLAAHQGWTRRSQQSSRGPTAIAAAAPTPVAHTAQLLLSQQSIKPFPPRARSPAGVLLKTSFIIATQKCPCLCGPDKSLLAIKIVTHCKQQKLLTTITKNDQQTECQFPSWPVRGIFCRVLHSSDPIQETSPSWAVNQKLVLFWEKKL